MPIGTILTSCCGYQIIALSTSCRELYSPADLLVAAQPSCAYCPAQLRQTDTPRVACVFFFCSNVNKACDSTMRMKPPPGETRGIGAEPGMPRTKEVHRISQAPGSGLRASGFTVGHRAHSQSQTADRTAITVRFTSDNTETPRGARDRDSPRSWSRRNGRVTRRQTGLELLTCSVCDTRTKCPSFGRTFAAQLCKKLSRLKVILFFISAPLAQKKSA